MPHVVILGNVTPKDLWETFQPLEVRQGPEVRKVDHAYLDRENSTVLFSALAVSHGYRQRFFVQATRKGDKGVTVRLEPMTDPEKTDAVRFTIAAVAQWALHSRPGLEFGDTNIQDYLAQAAEAFPAR